MKLIVTDQSGKIHDLEAVSGWRVMEIIREYGLPIKAECGGACACATCHVYVDETWIDKIPEMREDEEEMLDEAFHLQENSRLSCQIIMEGELDGLHVILAENEN